jgi:putative peptide zinc metalloprotease protein
MIRTRSLALAAALLISFALPAAASAQDNAAVAINTKDGSSIFRLAFDVRRTMHDVVDSSNAAVAFSSCESCRTVAVAIQVVLVMSDPTVVSPENVALAINLECVACATLASAYQYVTTVGGPVHFDAEGSKEIAEIRKALRDLAKQPDLPLEVVQAEVDALVERLYAVLDTHLVPAGRGPTPAPTPPPSPTPGTPPETPAAGATVTPAPSPAPSPEPSAEPSSPEPSPSAPTPRPEASP